MGAATMRQWLGHVFTVSFSLFLLLVVVLLVRTFTLTPRAIPAPPCDVSEATFIALDQPRLDRFRQALRYKTISQEGGVVDAAELTKLQQFIKTSYPTLHKSPLVTLEVVQNFSLLYTVQGSNASLQPFLLMGHLDVVPESPGDWHAKPFSGDVLGDFIYGRGTIDMKHSVFGILEALEFLLQSGHTPQRPFYVAFGHDEEIQGYQGAAHVGRLLGERGVKLEFIADEGLVVARNLVPGMRDNPTALIGTSEKGFATLRLTANLTGGHSSMPDRESAIGILAAAVARLESNPQPLMFGRGPEIGMLEHLAPQMDFFHRVLMTNLWLFGPIISRVLAGKPSSSALIRTTTAITKFNAGIKDNVIAPTATATVNHRIHPAQTLDEVLAHDIWALNDDRVHVEILSYKPAMPQSSYADNSFGYQTIKTSIRQIWGHENVAVAPGLLVGNTDTHHYSHLTPNIYRFSPTVMFPEDVARFHGLNERISIKNYEQAINFFYHVMVNADKEKLEPAHQHGEEL